MALGQAALPQATAAPGLAPQNDLHAKWMSYLTAPETRAALMQFGVGMLQPRTNGQTLSGQIGQAVGEAGQAAGRVQQTQLEIGRQARQEARDQGQLEIAKEGNVLEAERNKIAAREQATRANESAANIANQKGQLELDREKLKVQQFQAKSLDLYYKSLAGAASVKSAPVGYKEALDALKESSLLQDDPMAYFMQQLPIVNQQFGVGGTAPTSGEGAGGPAAAPVDVSKIDPQAVQILKSSPDAETKRQFDMVFGAGAADAVLKGQ